ncbi:hypothetical protein ACW9KT_21775 [Hymenobacter sp. HD11105]
MAIFNPTTPSYTARVRASPFLWSSSLFLSFLMLLRKVCSGAALLLALPRLSTAATPPITPDSLARRQLLTLHTLRLTSPFTPALGYERGVGSRWSVRASLGGDHARQRSRFSGLDPTGTPITFSTQFRTTDLIADASLNYYLQARQPSLIGWFVGAGLIGAYSHSRAIQESPTAASSTSQDVQVRPLLRAGRHWALGQRWLVDTHVAVAVSIARRPRVALTEFIGLGAGYRF